MNTSIIKNQNLSNDKVAVVSDMMRYNMWTMAQFCDLTGYKPSTITNMTRPNYKGGELVTVMMKAFAIVWMECATDSLVAGPVTIHANGYNTTTGFLEVDDASVTAANMVGWALDAGDDGDLLARSP